VNAEDPFNNFSPCPGKLELYYAPGGRGVRIDSHAYTGYTVPPHYDSMIAKVIAMGTSRENAIARMRRALSEYIIRGIKTTIPFQQAIMHDPDFVRGSYDTGFVAKLIDARGAEFGKK
jgi:acetyl-CoA carboxylase biotin carboxylase subunit